MTENDTCNICCNKYTKKSRTEVECCFCNFIACRECYETYLLTINNSRCMNNECDKLWTRKFLNEKFTKHFITNKYKKHLEKIFFDKERSLLPATQQVVERIIKQEELIEENIQLDKTMTQMYKLNSLGNNIVELKMNENIYKKWMDNSLIKMIENLDIEKVKFESSDFLNKAREISTIKHNNTIYLNSDGKEKVERKQFIRKCGNYLCRGFLSTQWKCGICSKSTCKECHVYKDNEEEHECKKEDIETAKLLNTDSKPCPKCAVIIFKVDGCDQMWCTECNTAFSWKTGTIETKSIHNPHYYEYLRKNQTVMPRNPNDIICGRDLNYNIIPSTVKYVNEKIFSRLFIIIGSTMHIQRVELPRFEINDFLNNEKLRISYLRNRISEEDFCIKLQREYKKYDKNKELHSIISMYISSVTDIVYRFIDYYNKNIIESDLHNLSNVKIKKYDKDEILELNNILNEINYLIEYVNDYLDQISITFQSVTYEITLPVGNGTTTAFYDVFHSVNKKSKYATENDESKCETI